MHHPAARAPLRASRYEAGALNLASPEIKISRKDDTETNSALDVKMYELRETNMMVEEMMLMANIAVATRIHAAFPSAAVLRRHEPPTPEMFEPLMQVRWRLARVRLMVKRALCEGCKWRSVAVVCFSAAVWALLACNCRLACVPARPLPSPEQLASTHGTQNAAPLQHICFALGCSTLTTSSHEQIARARGIKLDAASSKQLAESLDAAKSIKDPYFNKLLRILATRCMTQAKYFSSGELAPAQFVHYGLAVPIYTHFTSPIRRCADCSTVALVADANAAQSAQAAESWSHGAGHAAHCRGANSARPCVQCWDHS